MVLGVAGGLLLVGFARASGVLGQQGCSKRSWKGSFKKYATS